MLCRRSVTNARPWCHAEWRNALWFLFSRRWWSRNRTDFQSLSWTYAGRTGLELGLSIPPTPQPRRFFHLGQVCGSTMGDIRCIVESIGSCCKMIICSPMRKSRAATLVLKIGGEQHPYERWLQRITLLTDVVDVDSAFFCRSLSFAVLPWKMPPHVMTTARKIGTVYAIWLTAYCHALPYYILSGNETKISVGTNATYFFT